MMRIILDLCNEKLLSVKKNERRKLNIEKLAAKFMHILEKFSLSSQGEASALVYAPVVELIIVMCDSD